MIKLAHASIMKLNQNSMAKLLELISVSFKLQLLSMEDPTELLQITLRHLDALKDIITQTGKDTSQIDNAIKTISEVFLLVICEKKTYYFRHFFDSPKQNPKFLKKSCVGHFQPLIMK